ncbi:MAG: hypothetical protein LBQ45_00410 [Mycoplasmataceae bacterium]|jgi:hypothetical protein|nr:hypothetical protein [Mycoplasmataceae bacterium]
MNIICETPVSEKDRMWLRKNQPLYYKKFVEIYKYLEKENPPYKAYKAKYFKKDQGFSECWSMHRIIFKYNAPEKQIIIYRICGHYNDR